MSRTTDLRRLPLPVDPESRPPGTLADALASLPGELEQNREELAPRCARCGNRHLAGITCWRGRYAGRIVHAVLLEQGRTCWLCGGGGADSADHVIPRSRGGTDDPENLRPAHRRCNSRRQHHDPFTPDPHPQPAGVGLSPRWRPGGDTA